MAIRLNTDSNRTLSASSAAIPTLLGQPALIALSLRGSEGVNSLFDYRLVLKTPDSLKHLIGDTVNFDTDAWRGAGDYRPDINTSVPHMYGVESAVVVGPRQQGQAGQHAGQNDSDATQFFTPLPVLMHGGLETLVPQSRPPQAANPMREPNEDQTGFVLQSHGNHGRRYTREPVQLFNGDQLVATRVTGNGGELRLPLPGSTTQYSIRFADGRAYPITPEKALEGGKKLANQGWRDHAVSHKTSS